MVVSGKETNEIQGFNFIASHDINEPKTKFEDDDEVLQRIDYDEVPIRYRNLIIICQIIVHKVEKISEDSLDLIPSPSVIIQIMGGKVSLR